MTDNVREAVYDVINNGVHASVDSLDLVVSDALVEYLKKEDGYLPIITVRPSHIHADRTHVRVSCGCCDQMFDIQEYPNQMWNDYMKDHYNPTLPVYCKKCGTRVRVLEEERDGVSVT